MHGNDHGEAAGGFIHGYRYLIRALHRFLELFEEEPYSRNGTESYWSKYSQQLQTDGNRHVKHKRHKRRGANKGMSPKEKQTRRSKLAKLLETKVKNIPRVSIKY